MKTTENAQFTQSVQNLLKDDKDTAETQAKNKTVRIYLSMTSFWALFCMLLDEGFLQFFIA